ncbi:NAD-dependent epimerase/dehydratase family protein [Gammaproteobacteria bacterium]|nr:NAD-dependent epimerase/dehydratase family protein [Gammaproteobacteria bacterium]
MLKQNILIIGRNSFLASGIYDRCKNNPNLNITLIGYLDLPESYEAFDWVINCAFNNQQYIHEMDISNNYDLKVSKAIKNYDTKYLFLSSRAVYGTHDQLKKHDESFEAEDSLITQYGRNKLNCEKIILDELPSSRVLICRCANIFGIEAGEKFFGIAQKSLLKNNKIILNMSKKVIKDFLPLPSFAEIIEQLLINNIIGKYNIGSGIETNLDEICSSLIKGYGSGSIINSSSLLRDQFILDISKLQAVIDFDITKEKILSYTYNIGKLLKRSNEQV